jgi:nucleotide sugar dehydrogenase
VTGLELPSAEGLARTDMVNQGLFPYSCSDLHIVSATNEHVKAGRLRATTDPHVLATADVIIVSVNLDLERLTLDSAPVYGPMQQAVKTIGMLIRPSALVIVESTVPVGTCRDIVEPLLRHCFGRRALDGATPLVAFSYERVTPGPDYLTSMKRLPRVYAADSALAAEAAGRFFSLCAGPDGQAPRRLGLTVAAEFAKLLENAYRAVNIALLDEWSHFGESIGVDVFDIVEAIRQRPTHTNIREPGLGIGGYCLTKDPILAMSGHAKDRRADSFPLTARAVEIGQAMPSRVVRDLVNMLGDLNHARILLLGVTYRSGVADTRCSASEAVFRDLTKLGARVICHDPLARTWPETGAVVRAELPAPADFDAVLFAVAHDEYLVLDLGGWLADAKPLIFDTNHVLTAEQIEQAQKSGVMLRVIGRGDLT